MTRRIVAATAFGLFGLLAATPSQAQTYDLSWHTVDGGGVTFATGGPYSLGATAGQPDASNALSGGTFSLVGGFWGVAIGPPEGLSFFTLVPCRVVDTRGNGAPIGGPVLEGQQTRVFAVADICGIPASAKALSINLTVTQPNAAGNVRLFPAGPTVPNASSINYVAAQTRANNAVVSLNGNAELAAFVGQPAGTTVHLIIDVNGYFE
jgi:hypothetical protein